MKKNSFIVAVLLFALPVFSQAPKPSGFGNLVAWTLWIETGSITMSNKTLTAPTLTTPTLTGISTLTTTNAATTGTYRSLAIGHTQTGASASAIIEALRVNVDANVMTGDWTNAVVARVDYGASGNANGGMVAPLCAELSLPPASLSGGAYYVADLEMEAPENYVSHGNVSYPTAWLNIAVYGNATAIGSLEDNAFLFRTDGFTSASGNMIYNNTIRARVGSTTWYMPLSSAEGEYETAYLIDVTNTTDASSLTAASIQTDGGLAVAKQLYLGDDLDLSVSGTGIYDITLKDGVADALSIVRGTTDVMVFNTTTPSVTITPATTVTGQLTTSAGINLGTSQSIVATTGMTIGSNAETVAINSSDWDIDATGIATGLGNVTMGETLTLLNGETISNGTDGTITQTGKSVIDATRVDNTTGYEYWLDVGGAITSTGDGSHGAKTFGINCSISRAAGVNTANGDMEDALIKGTITNRATANAASYIVRGINVMAQNRDGNADQDDVNWLEGAYISAKNQTALTGTAEMRGVYCRVDLDPSTTATTETGALKAELDLDANAPSVSYGVQAYYQSAGSYTLPQNAFWVNTGTSDKWEYGLAYKAGSINNADMLLSSGAKVFTGTAANGDAVYAEVGAKDAVGSIYLNATNGYIYIQVADVGAATDWFKVTATDAD